MEKNVFASLAFIILASLSTLEVSAQDFSTSQYSVAVKYHREVPILGSYGGMGFGLAYTAETTIPATNFFSDAGASLSVIWFNERDELRFETIVSAPIGFGYKILNYKMDSNHVIVIKELFHIAPLVSYIDKHIYFGLMPELGFSFHFDDIGISFMPALIVMFNKENGARMHLGFNAGISCSF